MPRATPVANYLFCPLSVLLWLTTTPGCTAHCLRGSCPVVGRPVPDEMLALLRRELPRSESGSELPRAAIIEAIPGLFPDLSDMPGPPQCAAEWTERLSAQVLAERPIEYSRLLIARIHSVGRVHDTVPVMAAKARFLLTLAQLPEAQLTSYQLSPGESGPPAPTFWVRYLALGYLVHSSLILNVAEVRAYLVQRIVQARDDRELVLLRDSASSFLRDSVWGHPDHAQDDRAPSLLRAWIPDVRRRLQGIAEPLSLEVTIARVTEIGTYGTRFGVGTEARLLMGELLAGAGHFPLTQDNAAAAHDLEVAAAGALYDLTTPNTSTGNYWDLAPTRQLADPWRALSLEPVAHIVPEPERLARIAELDRELSRLVYSVPRCLVLRQLTEQLTALEAEARFDELAAPIKDSAGRIRASSESFCRMRLLLGLPQLSVSRRIALLAELLQAPPEQITEYDGRADEHHPFLIYDTGKSQVLGIAAKVLAEQLAWIDLDTHLRTWLQQQALVPPPQHNDYVEDTALHALQPALSALLSGAGGQVMPVDEQTGQQIVHSWLEHIRATLLRDDITSMYPGATARARMLAIATCARTFGLEVEARALFEQLLNQSTPSPFGTRFVESYNDVARTATIALRVLARAEP